VNPLDFKNLPTTSPELWDDLIGMMARGANETQFEFQASIHEEDLKNIRYTHFLSMVALLASSLKPSETVAFGMAWNRSPKGKGITNG
jgi:hypothetical protein